MNTNNQSLQTTLTNFYNLTEIPITLLENGKKEFSLPKKIIKAENLINEKNSSNTILQNDNSTQIIQNKYKEVEIVIKLNSEQIIAMGPVLNEKIEIGTLTNMVRNNIIPFHQKSEMFTYYKNTKVLDKEKMYYAIKILKQLINNKEKNLNNDDETIILDIKNESYYKQKSEYRLQSFLHSPYFIEQKISKSISNGDVENSKKLLKEINSIPHAKLASSSLRSYKNSMICSCSYMTRAAIAGGANPDEAFTLSDTYINKIENLLTIKELERLEVNMIEGFTNIVKNVKTQSYSPAVLNTIYYIDNHLCDDLKIETIAKNVYLNPCYLSTLFHKETGQTLKDWILTKRIQESAHLVSTSKEKIAEIAFFYGFSSQSYYVQCFKKIIGTTPGQFRKNPTIE